MEKTATKRLSREDWVRGALDILLERGADGIKIVVIAQRMGVTSGSFYWHFKGLRDLLDCVLEYWEVDLTDRIVVSARDFVGAPEDRIFTLMRQVVENDAAIHDNAIAVWARSDPFAREIYERTLKARFEFASWMFAEVGFSKENSDIRGRLMVTYLMDESSTNMKSSGDWINTLRDIHKLLVRPAN